MELLGGRYQQGEQVVPGAVQAFRSYEVPTGRPVVIHRVAMEEPVAKEVATLLSAALVRSPAVRKMVLDVYETEAFRYVVTETAPECLALKEWLEHEAEVGAPKRTAPREVAPAANVAPEAPANAEPATRVRVVPAPVQEEEEEELEPEDNSVPSDGSPSEFNRMLQNAIAGGGRVPAAAAAIEAAKTESTAGAKPAPLAGEAAGVEPRLSPAELFSQFGAPAQMPRSSRVLIWVLVVTIVAALLVAGYFIFVNSR